MALLLSDDERSTLQAALAFVDAHFDARTPSRETAQRRQKKSEAAEQARRKRRNELLQLREEHQELQAKLDALCTRGAAKEMGESASEGSEWEETRLREALALNKRLRTAVDHYGGVVAQVTQLLSQRRDLKCVQEMVLEAGLSLDACRDLPLRKERHDIYSVLKGRLKACIVDATAAAVAVCKATALSDARTRVYPHPVHGSVVEATSFLSLPCSKEQAWAFEVDMLHGSLLTTHRREYNYMYQSHFSAAQNAFEKEYSLAFTDTERGERVPVDGLSLLGFAETPQGMIYAWSSVVSIPGKDIRIHTCGWSSIMAAASGDMCVFRDHFELFCDKATSFSSHEAKNYKSKFLVESLVEKARRDRLHAEEALVRRFGSDASCVSSLIFQ